MVNSRNTCHFRIGKGLNFLAERALGEENQVDLPNGVLAIRNLPSEAILRRCDLQLAGQALVGTGLEEVGNTLECRSHFCSGERCQLVSGVEVRGEEVQNSFVIEPVAVHAHATLRPEMAEFEPFREACLDKVVRDGLHEFGELEAAIGLGARQKFLSEVVEEFFAGLLHQSSPKMAASSHS